VLVLMAALRSPEASTLPMGAILREWEATVTPLRT